MKKFFIFVMPVSHEGRVLPVEDYLLSVSMGIFYFPTVPVLTGCEKLLNDIMDLYQENIPFLLSSTDVYVQWKTQLFVFGARNRKRLTDSTYNTPAMLMEDEAHNLAGYLARPNEIINRYDVCIEKMEAIVKEVEERCGIKE